MKLEERIRVIDRNKIIDIRGWFLKIINGKEESLPPFTGEIYIISINPGESRANHYHIEANEWFTLVTGRAEMLIEDIENKKRIVIALNSKHPKTIYVPNNIAHSFQNKFDEPCMLVTYADRLFDISDTKPYKF